jgi:hypothetical protein
MGNAQRLRKQVRQKNATPFEKAGLIVNWHDIFIASLKPKDMNRIIWILLLPFAFLLTDCSNKQLGERVREPFSGSKYQSNNRFFRAVGKGVSTRDNIAAGKADIEAKRILAQQVQTSVKVVTDQYIQETSTPNGTELSDIFQSLAREVTNTQIGDLRKIGEEKYLNGDQFTVFIAYEIRKTRMFRFLKRMAQNDNRIDAQTRKMIEDILDKEIARLEAEGND